MSKFDHICILNCRLNRTGTGMHKEERVSWADINTFKRMTQASHNYGNQSGKYYTECAPVAKESYLSWLRFIACVILFGHAVYPLYIYTKDDTLDDAIAEVTEDVNRMPLWNVDSVSVLHGIKTMTV